MAIQTTEAIILKAFNWSESSRTVHFLTKRFGKIPLVDRGGRSIKSRRGRLLSFAAMEIGFYASEKASTGHISSVEIKEVFDFSAEGTLGRLAYASAACELLYRIMPEAEAQPQTYNYLVSCFRLINTVDKRFIPAIFVTFLLRLISQMGFHPSLSYCLGCSQESEGFATESKPIKFAPERGGILCQTCQKPGETYIDLPREDLSLMIALQRSSLADSAKLPLGYQHATRIIDTLARFLGYQADIKPKLNSLEFLEKLKNSQLNG